MPLNNYQQYIAYHSTIIIPDKNTHNSDKKQEAAKSNGNGNGNGTPSGDD